MSDLLAERFERSRARLRAVAQRMLGSASEAEDAVQEAWLKLSRGDTSGVENLEGWLTTVVARVCLDMLRARRPRPDDAAAPAAAGDPELDVGLADAIGPALLVVLDTLAPAERVAFVLHDMFDLSFEEIAPIVDRTPAAARKLASRARRRVRGARVPSEAPDRTLVSAFLAASRDGDFERLLAVLSPGAVLRADALAVRTAAEREKQGAPSLAPEVRGAAQVAQAFKGRARGALPAFIDGAPGAVWMMAKQVRAAFLFTVADGRIAAIELVMEPARLAGLEIEIAG